MKEKVYNIEILGNPYLVPLQDIKIPMRFLTHPPKMDKLMERVRWFANTGKFSVPIIIDKNFVLRDGYTSYLAAKRYQKVNVEVYFI